MEYRLHQNPAMEACIQNCEKCHHTCIETLHYCLTQGGIHAEADHITLLQDCIQICHTSSDYMLRDSSLHALTCWVCAEVCTRCAEDCDRVGAGDSQMKICADVCRICAASCRDMATHEMPNLMS